MLLIGGMQYHCSALEAQQRYIVTIN
jgi:hypothetical protein